VGRDKGCLTEQQTKQTVITKIQIRSIYKTAEMHRAIPTAWWSMHSRAATNLPPASFPTQNPAWRHMVSNTLFCLAGLGHPTHLCPLLASGENQTCPGRTQDTMHTFYSDK